MNRYFYVPVMDACIKHDGVTLRDHLRVVDPELYERECRYFNELCDFPFEDGVLFAKKLRKADRHNAKTDRLFRERDLPRFLVIVYSKGRLYELSTEEEFDLTSLGDLQCFETVGLSVVDIFCDNPSYTPCARNFFQTYEENKDKLTSLEETSFKQKILQRFPFHPGKSHK